MPIYNWHGINQEGKKICGLEPAANLTQLKNKLSHQNIFPLRIKSQSSLTNWFGHRIKTKHTNHFIDQLAILISNNTPIVKALKIMLQEENNLALKNLITLCQNSIAEGKSLSQTWNDYPEYFSALSCGLINAGEQSGKLDLILQELSSYLKKTALEKSKIIKALIYPATVLVVTIMVITIFLVFVIPQFATMFNNFGAELPRYTQTIIYCSNFIQTYWQIILTGIIGAIISIKIMHYRSLKFREFLDYTYFKLPIIKKILLAATLTKFTKTLGLTLNSGIPLLQAMNIAIPTVTSLHYIAALKNTTELVALGKPLHQALIKQQLFPTKMIQLLALGEETGTLDQMLTQISKIYEEELNNITDNLNKLLEPIIIIILGLIVGSLVIGMYLPIFRLGTVV